MLLQDIQDMSSESQGCAGDRANSETNSGKGGYDREILIDRSASLLKLLGGEQRRK